MAHVTRTDEELMAAYVAGDRSAFDALFERIAPRVHRFFVRTFGSPALADDLLQQTFLKVHRARGDYRGDSKVASWIFAIAARVRLDELRRRRRLPESPDLGGEEALARADEEAALAAAQDRADPVESRAIADRVQAALARLPESQRVVIQLHRWEGMSFAEIAQVLGTTEGAVKLRAFRGYEALREELKDLAR